MERVRSSEHCWRNWGNPMRKRILDNWLLFAAVIGAGLSWLFLARYRADAVTAMLLVLVLALLCCNQRLRIENQRLRGRLARK